MPQSPEAEQGAGGLLLQLMGLPFVLLLDGSSFLISTWAGLLIRPPSVTPKPPANGLGLPRQLLADALEGLGYVWRDKGVRTLMLGLWGSTFFLSPILALLPFFVTDQRFLDAGSEWHGFLMGGMGVGGLFGHWLNVVCESRCTPSVPDPLLQNPNRTILNQVDYVTFTR